MIYKQEIQNKNSEKLKRKLESEQVPDFIKDFFFNIRSSLGALNYWVAIKDLLKYLLENRIIDKSCISEITPADFVGVKSVHINNYLNSKDKTMSVEEPDSSNPYLIRVPGMMAPTTLRTRKNIFKSFWNHLIYDQECPVQVNIVDKVAYKGLSTASRNDILQKKLPSEERLNRMENRLSAVEDPVLRVRNLAVFHLLKGSGIREGELAGLDIFDLCLDEEVPYIKVVGKGKIRKIEARIVYLTGNAVIHLREWLEVRELLKVKNTKAVFLNKNRKRLNEDNIRDIFKKYGEGITPHMIRHWYVTLLADMGKVIFAQQNSGHKSEKTTINNYVSSVYGMKEILANM